MTSLLEHMLGQFDARQNDRFKAIEQRLANPSSDHEAYVHRRRLALARYAESTKAQRRQAFLDEGMSADEAALAAAEPLDVPGASTAHHTPSKRYHIKSDDIGHFDGDRQRFAFWANRVGRLYHSKMDPAWKEAVIDMLPMCLKGTAAYWYERQHSEILDTWEQWYKALSLEFAEDPTEVKRRAENRKWNPNKEQISDYFHEKYTLLKSAYKGFSESDIVFSIKDGLPDGMQALLRTDLSRNPNAQFFLAEIQRQEALYRRMHGATFGPNAAGKARAASDEAKSSRREDEGTSRARAQSSPSTSLVRGSSAPQGARRSLKETYDERNVMYRDGRRWYHAPGTQNAIPLNRNCRLCGGEHFDFEHDHITQRSDIKKEARFAIEGYAAYPLAEMDTTMYESASSGSGTASDPVDVDSSTEN